MEFPCSVITFEDSSKQMPSHIANLDMQLSFHTSLMRFSVLVFLLGYRFPRTGWAFFGVHATGDCN
jgi:hypothetical protein